MSLTAPSPILGLVNEFLKTHSGTFGSDFMLQMVSGVLIYFMLYYLLFTLSSAGKFLPMSSHEYKKGFVQVYLFLDLLGRWGVTFSI